MEKKQEGGNFINIGGLIGAIGGVFLFYKIAPHATMSNFLYIVVLAVGWVVGSLIYNFLSK